MRRIIIILIALVFFAPQAVFALDMPANGSDLANMAGIAAQAYIVADAQTGQVLIQKNADQQWTPASLTKLVTALVVLDSKTKLAKVVAMTQADQDAGWCTRGGACIKSKPGITFTVDGLFHAALMPSANNAAHALARSTGFTDAVFVAKMNAKVKELGATASHFNEPTGLDPQNIITAQDYSKIIAAAFSNSYLQKIAALSQYTLRSSNNSKYTQVIKNTDKLLADADVQILGAKTGYLDESKYNFASLLQYQGGQKLVVVVLGEDHLYSAFAETKTLAGLAEAAQVLALFNTPNNVLGTSTQISLNN